MKMLFITSLRARVQHYHAMEITYIGIFIFYTARDQQQTARNHKFKHTNLLLF